MLEKMAVILIASFKYPMCQLEVRNVGPTATFEIIQWTGTLLVSVGGIALAQDKLKQSK